MEEDLPFPSLLDCRNHAFKINSGKSSFLLGGLGHGELNVFLRLFLKSSKTVFSIVLKIPRIYLLSFLFLPFPVFVTYCFSSIGKGESAILLSFPRGLPVPLFLLFSSRHVRQKLLSCGRGSGAKA